MKFNYQKTTLFLLITIGVGIFYFSQPALAMINLIKSASSPTIYYLDSQGIRHPFPNVITFQSWYGADFSQVLTVSDEFLANSPLGKNITIRPGKFLLKVPSDPKVYAVEQGGVLRWLELPAIAAAIYGEKWPEKIVDLPEVFFSDYQVGETLKHDYELPDSIVYKINNEDKYYWKSNRSLQPFASVAAMIANGYNLDDVISGSRYFYARARPITALDKNIFNPVALLITDTADCANKILRAAFIFISQGSYDRLQLEKLEAIKQALPQSFSWATNELAVINVDYPTVLFPDDGYLVAKNENNKKKLTPEVTFYFYDDHPDEFDFLIYFTDFDVAQNDEIADFVQVTNNVSGINRALLDASEMFGSAGKLKGIITMGDINQYDISTTRGMNTVQNYLLHEIAHQWGAAINFIAENGAVSDKLRRQPDLIHWSYYAGFISPLGGSGWQANPDNTFTSLLSQMADSTKKPYSALDLYLMGLLPAQVIAPVMYVEPTIVGAVGNTIAGTAKYVGIEQIIAANGKWQCER